MGVDGDPVVVEQRSFAGTRSADPTLLLAEERW
jgi:hypothetical protein